MSRKTAFLKAPFGFQHHFSYCRYVYWQNCTHNSVRINAVGWSYIAIFGVVFSVQPKSKIVLSKDPNVVSSQEEEDDIAKGNVANCHTVSASCGASYRGWVTASQRLASLANGCGSRVRAQVGQPSCSPSGDDKLVAGLCGQ